MTPFLFGARERPLFGIHTPAGGNRRRTGAVICPPFGPEYQRAHRAVRLLGERLAARGYDVLRFDYYGTGDSGGDVGDVTLSGSVADAGLAIEELSARADVRRVMLVGIRLGAAVAHRTAQRSRAVDTLTLWDPVVDGRSYLAQDPAGRAAAEAPVVRALRAELEALRADSFGPTGARRTLVVTSRADPLVPALLAGLSAEGGSAEHRHLESAPAWQEEAALGVGAVPVELLDVIAAAED